MRHQKNSLKLIMGLLFLVFSINLPMVSAGCFRPDYNLNVTIEPESECFSARTISECTANYTLSLKNNCEVDYKHVDDTGEEIVILANTSFHKGFVDESTYTFTSTENKNDYINVQLTRSEFEKESSFFSDKLIISILIFLIILSFLGYKLVLFIRKRSKKNE